MTRLFKFLIAVIITAAICISLHLYYLSTLAATENYPEDSYLETAPNKTALIIVAHDDDMVGSSGTISMLCQAGWKVREMCFYQQGGLYLEKNRIKNPVRKKSLEQVAKIQGMWGIDPVDLNFRNDMNTEKPYMPMPYSKFPENYKIDSLNTIIGNYIEQYKPTVIFSLDNIIGGYGNPDHVLIGQLVVNYCREHKHDAGFTVKKIYQPVFAPSLAERVLRKLPVYIEAKKVYQCDGMPLPDVQINIYPYASQKKEAMVAYTTEQNSLRKFWPYYHWYPSWIYFRIFDRDFFKVIDVDKL